MYKYILKPILFRFDPEFVHDYFVLIGEWLGKYWLTKNIVGIIYNYNYFNLKKYDISKTVDGITYRTPILLSAGFDYDARLINILPDVGFGGEEIGSVTARPYEGNKRPRLTRLPKSKSIIVNKGLKNEGVDRIIERLKIEGLKNNQDTRYKIQKNSNDKNQSSNMTRFVIGISIARTNDEQSAQSIQSGVDDYVYSFRSLNEENVGDFYTLNISCPNSFGGETFAKPEPLNQLLISINKIRNETNCTKPIYVKMPINLPWIEFNELLSIIDKFSLHGVVIGNLNKNYDDLKFRDEAPKEYVGGLSGEPCRELSNELIKKTRETYGKRFTIIGVGGIMSPQQAKEKFDAGADLIQLITGMIYEGPGLIKKIAKLARINLAND